MENFKKDDLCNGMVVTVRNGQAFKVQEDMYDVFGWLVVDKDNETTAVRKAGYTDDLYYEYGDEEHDLDIMRVALPSGAVLWERPIVELRVFDVSLYKASRGAVAAAYENTQEMIMQNYHFNLRPWYMECDGKLCSFTSPSGDGVCCGYTIARDWTRELTEYERRTWGKK